MEKSAVNVAKGKPLLENTTLKNVAEVKARVKGNNWLSGWRRYWLYLRLEFTSKMSSELYAFDNIH